MDRKYDDEDFNLSLRKAFSSGDSIIVDGWTFLSPFLRKCWQYANDKKWLDIEEIREDQCTTLIGKLNEKGKKELFKRE